MFCLAIVIQDNDSKKFIMSKSTIIWNQSFTSNFALQIFCTWVWFRKCLDDLPKNTTNLVNKFFGAFVCNFLVYWWQRLVIFQLQWKWKVKESANLLYLWGTAGKEELFKFFGVLFLISFQSTILDLPLSTFIWNSFGDYNTVSSVDADICGTCKVSACIWSIIKAYPISEKIPWLHIEEVFLLLDCWVTILMDTILPSKPLFIFHILVKLHCQCVLTTNSHRVAVIVVTDENTYFECRDGLPLNVLSLHQCEILYPKVLEIAQCVIPLLMQYKTEWFRSKISYTIGKNVLAVL